MPRRDYTPAVMARTDEELLQAARAGDDEALEALLARHEKQVFRFGLRMCGNEEDARDVLQETLLAAFKGMRQFRGDAQLSTWLYQVARSFCTKARRRGAGEPARHESLEGPAREVSAPASAPDERAHAREMARVLQEALLALPESQREVVLLRDVEGLSAEEAARVVGIEVPALKSPAAPRTPRDAGADRRAARRRPGESADVSRPGA
ncbi:MAG: RNA polymerase sigma factor [Myxococcaceae bacterium]